jgi:hypothetical protein
VNTPWRISKNDCNINTMYEKSLNLDFCLPTGQPPAAGRRYWIQCSDYRCLAVMDELGRWKSFYDGEDIPDFIRVVEPR